MALIYQYPTPIPMTVGEFPQLKFALFGDNLAAITTAGYLNSSNLAAAAPIGNQDIIFALYSYSQQTTSGTFAILTASVSGATGQITLSQWADAANVVLPVVSGNVASFSGTAGQIADAGFAASAVMRNNITNTLTASGRIIANKVNGTEAANAVTANGNAGQITTSALTTAGGASYAITWTDSQITATSDILLTLAGGTNTTKNITLQVVSGAGTATLTIYNNTAATALNGTVIINYLVM